MFNIFKSAPKHYQDLDGKTFKATFQQYPDVQLLAVRTPGEFASATLPGERNLDVTSSQVQAALNSLDKNTAYYVCCHSSTRSGAACRMPAEQGFKAYNRAGGIGAWPQ
jgi:rhodanese-related sulfurtransferase